MKTQIKMTDAEVYTYHSSMSLTPQIRLIGYITEHHKLGVDNISGSQVITSPVIKHDGNIYETKNTIYEVVSWKVKP